MSIDMYLGFSDAQTSSVEGILKNRISSYQSLQFALEQFIFASPSLTGETYDSAKRYSQIILIPLLKACILLDEAITSACAKLPSEYRNHVDSMDLRESELVEKINRADRLIGRYVDLIYLEYCKGTPNYPYISNLRSGEILQRRVKSQLEDKLRKLREYNTVSSKFFSDVPQLANAINTALRQTRTSWDGSSQTFVIPSSKELEWAKTMEEKWETTRNLKNNVVDAEKQVIIKNAMKAYSKGDIDRETLDSIRSGLLNASGAFISELGKTYFTEKAVEKFTKKAWEWLAYNYQNTQFAGLGALASGGIYVVPINVNPSYSTFVSGVAKYGAPIIGAAIDFTMQVQSGENIGHAATKTVGHVAIGIGAAKTGAVIGTAIGGPVGTAIGAVSGFVIGVAGSMIFDTIYDNVLKPFVEDPRKFIDNAVGGISNTLNDVGDAVVGFFKNINSVFQ